MTFGLGFGVYIIFLAIYWFFVYSVIWHLKEYILPGESSVWVVRFFLVLSVIFNIISVAMFIGLPF